MRNKPDVKGYKESMWTLFGFSVLFGAVGLPSWVAYATVCRWDDPISGVLIALGIFLLSIFGMFWAVKHRDELIG